LVAPQNRYWGATSLLHEALTALRRKLRNDDPDVTEPSAVGVIPGKAPKYLELAFDQVGSLDVIELPHALELLVILHIAVCAIVHAPIGSVSGTAAALGFASFDRFVVHRAQVLLGERVINQMKDHALRASIERATEEPTASGETVLAVARARRLTPGAVRLGHGRSGSRSPRSASCPR
jgi:hypothetical protein